VSVEPVGSGPARHLDLAVPVRMHRLVEAKTYIENALDMDVIDFRHEEFV
jgi:hypothetical protein